jgi:hypothetical protein
MIGGTHWTYKSICNVSLFSMKGACLSAKVIASNIGQCIATIRVLFAGVFWMKHVLNNYDLDHRVRTI